VMQLRHHLASCSCICSCAHVEKKICRSLHMLCCIALFLTDMICSPVRNPVSKKHTIPVTVPVNSSDPETYSQVSFCLEKKARRSLLGESAH
jgi:hypothetical protein